jgi:hypothetical protein
MFMGLIEKNFKQEKVTMVQTSKLTIPEYEFLFALIKNSSFKGEQLELLYNLTVKLQEEYFALKSKE